MPHKRKTIYHFKDFAPQPIKRSFFKTEYESFEEALDAANAWIRDHKVEVLNIETVVLPNMWQAGETIDMAYISNESGSYWYQFLRVWYKKLNW